MDWILAAKGWLIGADLWVFHLVNGWSGNWASDWLVSFAERNNLTKGAVVMAAYWWIWFTQGPREVTRKKLLLALIGAIVSLIAARALASTLPFRIRPMYRTDIGYQIPTLPPNAHPIELEDWSSFPSDQAALFFALAFGLWRCSRVAGVVAALFAAIWVSLVRVYLGIHFPSDIAVGAIVGIVCTYLTMALLARARLAEAILGLERRYSSAFYAAAFLITFEFASLFDDVRQFMHGALLVLRALGFGSIGLMGALMIGAAILVALSAVIAGGFSWIRKRHS